jgi:hypothetical protein
MRAEKNRRSRISPHVRENFPRPSPKIPALTAKIPRPVPSGNHTMNAVKMRTSDASKAAIIAEIAEIP